MANATSTQLQELYVAYFGRAADPSGLDYWTNKGITTKAFAASMHAQAEFSDEYGSKSVEEQVNQIYKNLFDRTADVDGLNYWTLQINLGNLKLAEIASDLIFAAQNNAGSEDDKATLTNKTAAAVAYTAEVGKTTEGILAYQPSNDGKEEGSTFTAGANLTEAKAFMAAIDGTTAHTESGVTASVNTIIAAGAPSVTGNSYTLTKVANTGLGSSSGNDTYVSSVISDGGGESTLTAGDILDGAGGTDILNVSISGTATAAVTTSAFTTTNIETLKITNFETSANVNTINTSLMSGLTSIDLNSSGSNGDTTVTEVASIVPVSMQNGTQDLTLTYASAILDGTEDTQAITVSNQTAGTFTVSDGDNDTVENISVTSTGGKNTLSFAAANKHEKVTIAGDKKLTLALNDTNNKTKTVDASASTGGVKVTDLGTTELAFTGGTGDDTIRIDGSTISGTTATLDAINGGDGTDTLELTVATNVTSSSNGAVVTNFEKVTGYASASDASLVVAQDVSLLGSTISTVGTTSWARSHGTTDGGNDYTATDGVNFSNLDADTDLVLSGITATGLDADDGVIVNFTATADLESDTAADSIDVTLGTTTAAATTATTGTNTAANIYLALADYETINIASQGGDNTVHTLTSNDATKLVITGDKKLTISNFSTTSIATLDASGATKVTMGAALSNKDITLTGATGESTYITGTGDDTITGGAGKDTITAGTGNDTVTTGDGDDTVNEVTGNDTVTTGDGDDTVLISDFSDLTSKDTIDAGTGTDTLKFAEAASHDFTSDTTIVANVSNFEKFSFSGINGSDTVTISDAVITGNTFKVEFTSDASGANTLNASGVLSGATTLTFDDNSGAATIYNVANAKDVVTMNGAGDTVAVTVNGYLAKTDDIDGGAGSDTLTFTADTASGTITIDADDQLAGVQNFETVSFNQGTDTNLLKYKVTLSDDFASRQVDAGSTLTITREAGDDGVLEVTGTAVSKNYKLALNGGDGADKLIGGLGDDTLWGETGADTLDVSAGGADDIRIKLNSEGNSKIVGFTYRGTSSTAPDDIDQILFDADEASGATTSDLFDAGGVVLAATNASETAGTITAITTTDYEEFVGDDPATSVANSGLIDNHINVITTYGYASLDAALKSNGVNDNGTTDIDGSMIVVFYNTGTQRAEIHDVMIADASGNNNTVITTTSTQIGYFDGLALGDIGNLDSTNFGVVSLG